MTKKEKLEEKDRALRYLKNLLRPGDTIFTTLKHVSRSGMYRRIGVCVIRRNNPIDIAGPVSTVLDLKWCDDGSVGIGGCGTDMGFEIAHCLGYKVFPEGFTCIKDAGVTCPSADHSNPGKERFTKGSHHDSGGYAFHHRWM